MTRARDRLYIAGFEGKNGQSAGCWYELISTALGDQLKNAEGHGGAKVRRLAEPQAATPKPRDSSQKQGAAAVALPPWFSRPAPREVALSVPLAPSRLEAYAPDETGEPLVEQPSRRRAPQRGAARAAAGRAIDRPPLPARHADPRPAAASADACPDGWAKAASGYLAARGEALSPAAPQKHRGRDARHFAKLRNSRRCSARAAAPRCRSSP